jgi:exonuclease III
MTKIISTISHNICEENIWNIVHWNVNSLRMRIKNNTFFKMIKDQNPDIIFLFETMTDLKKLNRYKNGEAMKKLKQMGYNYQYEHISTKLLRKWGYAGVMVLSKIEPYKVVTGIGDERFCNKQLIKKTGER